MNDRVRSKIGGIGDFFPAIRTFLRLLVRMNLLVTRQPAGLSKAFAALTASMTSFAGV